MNLLLSWATAARARLKRAPSSEPGQNDQSPSRNKGAGDLQIGNGGGFSSAPANNPPAPDSETLRTRARLMPGVVLPPAVDCLSFAHEDMTICRVLPEKFASSAMFEVNFSASAFHDDGSVLTTIVLPVIVDDGEGGPDKATCPSLPGLAGFGAGPRRAAENLLAEIKSLASHPHRFKELRPAAVNHPLSHEELFDYLLARLSAMQPAKDGWALSSAAFVCSLLDGLDIRIRPD